MGSNAKMKVFLKYFKKIAKAAIKYRFAIPGWLAGLLYKERFLRKNAWIYLKSKLYYENLFRYRCDHVGRNLMLFGEVPFITGTGSIYVGDNVEIFDKVTFFTGGHIYENPVIKIGDGCSLGFMVQLRVGQRVEIGNNCMIAGWVRISDYDGHPLDPQRKEQELKVDPEEVKPVIIEDDVWIGEGAIILKGVTIGKGSIISSGSVVTKSVPPMKIVMGNPGRVAMWVSSKGDNKPANG